MADSGKLTASISHEINNPTSFTNAAVFMMKGEVDDIKNFLKQWTSQSLLDTKWVTL